MSGHFIQVTVSNVRDLFLEHSVVLYSLSNVIKTIMLVVDVLCYTELNVMHIIVHISPYA